MQWLRVVLKLSEKERKNLSWFDRGEWDVVETVCGWIRKCESISIWKIFIDFLTLTVFTHKRTKKGIKLRDYQPERKGYKKVEADKFDLYALNSVW